MAENIAGAAFVLLLAGLQWLWENWRFVLPTAMGVLGLFWLHELGQGLVFVSTQIAELRVQVETLRETLGDVKDDVARLKDEVAALKPEELDDEELDDEELDYDD